MHTVNKIPKKELEKIEKILIIQYKPFGDVLLNTGYLPTLREHFLNAQIDYLIQKPYATLLEDNPYLDNLILMQKKKKKGLSYLTYLIERLRIMYLVRSNSYDVIIDQLRGTGSAQITLFSGAQYRLGWIQKRWRWVYNYRVKRDNLRYYSRAKFDLLQPLGIKEVAHNTYYKIKKSSKIKIENWLNQKNLHNTRFVVFSPGTPVKAKQWELNNFAELGDMIIEKTDLKLILLWGPGEKKDVEFIKNRMNNVPIIAIPTNFNEAGALLQRATLYISHDGGINHLAVAMETPSITIFGPYSNPKKWSAWHKKYHTYLRDWNFKRRDYRQTKNQSFNISPEIVFKKMEKLLKIIEEK
mgnify:CR=1 FL=1